MFNHGSVQITQATGSFSIVSVLVDAETFLSTSENGIPAGDSFVLGTVNVPS